LCTTFLGGYVVTLKIEKSRIGFVEPMLALPVTKLPEGRAWSYELKFDGYRALGVKAAHRWTEIHLGRSSGQKPPKF
jgi:hypothetical protein